MKLKAVVPCRAGSERISNKNTRPFAGLSGGLLRRKILQLIDVPELDSIVISTNDPRVEAIAEEYRGFNVEIDRRPESLCQSSTNLQDLCQYLGERFPDDHLLWTHVTSPFVESAHYSAALRTYISPSSAPFDSLASVQRVQKYLISELGPLNFGSGTRKWPRTQDLPPLFEVTSGIFLTSATVLGEARDRIGQVPFFFELDGLAGMDIDDELDFKLAELAIPVAQAQIRENQIPGVFPRVTGVDWNRNL